MTILVYFVKKCFVVHTAHPAAAPEEQNIFKYVVEYFLWYISQSRRIR
jgi:hypothetical protein